MSNNEESTIALIMTLVAESEALSHSVHRMETVVYNLGAAGIALVEGLQDLVAQMPDLTISNSLAQAILQTNDATIELAPALIRVANSVESFLMAAEKLVAILANRNSQEPLQ